MSTVSHLVPNSTVANVDAWGITGAGSVNAALADGVDSSYVTPSSDTYSSITVGLGTFTLPASAVVVQLTLFARVLVGDTNTGFTCILIDGNTGVPLIDSPVTNSVAISLNPGTAPSFGGENYQTSVAWVGNLTQSQIDNLQITFSSTVDNIATPASLNVYEVYAEVTYNQLPITATPVVTPATPILVTTRPTTSWGYSDADGDPQQKYRVKVFSAAQYGAGSFNAETSTATYDSGEKIGNASSFTLDASLANNTTYKSYVKTSDGVAGYSAWAASAAYSLTVNSPATPTVVATADNANSRIALLINAFDNLLSTNQASLETDTTGWAAITNCSIGRTTAQAADGTASLQLTSTAGGNMAAQTLTGTSGVAVSPNTVYEAVANFRSAVSARSVNIGIKWYKADGSASATPLSTGSNVTDATANFTTQAVLAVTSPADAAFAAVIVTVVATGAGSEVHYVDKISIAPGTSTAWTRGGLLSTQAIVLQRSADNGVTWVTLTRPSPDLPATATVAGVIHLPSTQIGVAYDYETVRGQTYFYRVYTTATDTIYTLDSAFSSTSSQQVSLNDQCKWNIKVPESPTLNVLNATLEFQDPFLNRTRLETSAFFNAIGRTRAVKVTDTVMGDQFALTVTCLSATQYTALIAALNAQKTLLLQDPIGRQWYMGLDSVVTLSDSLIPSLYYRAVSFNCIEVDAP